jgi:hypothetical protein
MEPTVLDPPAVKTPLVVSPAPRATTPMPRTDLPVVPRAAVAVAVDVAASTPAWALPALDLPVQAHPLAQQEWLSLNRPMTPKGGASSAQPAAAFSPLPQTPPQGVAMPLILSANDAGDKNASKQIASTDAPPAIVSGTERLAASEAYLASLPEQSRLILDLAWQGLVDGAEKGLWPMPEPFGPDTPVYFDVPKEDLLDEMPGWLEGSSGPYSVFKGAHGEHASVEALEDFMRDEGAPVPSGEVEGRVGAFIPLVASTRATRQIQVALGQLTRGGLIHVLGDSTTMRANDVRRLQSDVKDRAAEAAAVFRDLFHFAIHEPVTGTLVVPPTQRSLDRLYEARLAAKQPVPASTFPRLSQPQDAPQQIDWSGLNDQFMLLYNETMAMKPPREIGASMVDDGGNLRLINAEVGEEESYRPSPLEQRLVLVHTHPGPILLPHLSMGDFNASVNGGHIMAVSPFGEQSLLLITDKTPKDFKVSQARHAEFEAIEDDLLDAALKLSGNPLSFSSAEIEAIKNDVWNAAQKRWGYVSEVHHAFNARVAADMNAVYYVGKNGVFERRLP